MKNDTLKKLKNMRLPMFAEEYQRQIENEIEFQTLSFHERLALLADAEYNSRHNNNIQRLNKNARFVNSSAYLRNIEIFQIAILIVICSRAYQIMSIFVRH